MSLEYVTGTIVRYRAPGAERKLLTDHRDEAGARMYVYLDGDLRGAIGYMPIAGCTPEFYEALDD